MRGRLYLGILAGVIGFGLLNTAARAQSFPMEGKILSASVLVTSTGGTIVFTTPHDGHFILTQFCSNPSNPDNPRLLGSTFGNIATTDNNSGPTCYSFNPGFALPRNEVLTCYSTAPSKDTPAFCSISGILEDEK
jgi:hypothetical protein